MRPRRPGCASGVSALKRAFCSSLSELYK
jgi:hypothetical protein